MKKKALPNQRTIIQSLYINIQIEYLTLLCFCIKSMAGDQQGWLNQSIHFLLQFISKNYYCS